VDRVEGLRQRPVLQHEFKLAESVRLHELERVVGLGDVVDPDDVEPCAVVSHRRTSCTGEQVEESHAHAFQQ
jgi:hypothetical protein